MYLLLILQRLYNSVMMDRDDEEVIGFLEEQGAVVWEGMDEDGEAVFKFDLDRLNAVMPELYDEIMKDLDKDLMALCQEGFVEIEYDENLNALFRITEKGEEWAKNLIDPPFPFQN